MNILANTTVTEQMKGALGPYCPWGGWTETANMVCNLPLTLWGQHVGFRAFYKEDKVEEVVARRLSAAGLVKERRKACYSLLSHPPGNLCKNYLGGDALRSCPWYTFETKDGKRIHTPRPENPRWKLPSLS